MSLICLLFCCSICIAQTVAVPLVDASTGAILGGVRNGKFVRSQETVRSVKVGDRFTYFGIYSQNIGGAKLSKIDKAAEECSGTFVADIKGPHEDGILIGKTAGWDPMVRTHEVLFDGYKPSWSDLRFWNNQTYNKVIYDLLRSKGIKSPNAKIVQAFRVDLEGDGSHEVILVAQKYNYIVSAIPSEDDYSIVVLRKVVGKTVNNILLTGNIGNPGMPDGSPSLFNISAITDLNGDGSLEIVVGSKEYEGHSVQVFQVRNALVSRPMSIYCGT